jgi:hypothetical protein
MTFALAQNTAWTEAQILWEVPLSRALQYWHAYLYSNGVWTVPKAPPADETILRLSAFIESIDEAEDV